MRWAGVKQFFTPLSRRRVIFFVVDVSVALLVKLIRDQFFRAAFIRDVLCKCNGDMWIAFFGVWMRFCFSSYLPFLWFLSSLRLTVLTLRFYLPYVFISCAVVMCSCCVFVVSVCVCHRDVLLHGDCVCSRICVPCVSVCVCVLFICVFFSVLPHVHVCVLVFCVSGRVRSKII